MRLAWLTDIHLNFLAPPQTDEFFGQVAAQEPDAVVLTGDVGEAHDVVDLLDRMASRLDCPIYFVLGNHDFYRGSIAQVRGAVAHLARRRPNLVYLTESEPVALTAGWTVIGHDGWADAREGDYERSMVMMNDYRLIAELAGANKQSRLPLLRHLGDEAAEHVRRMLLRALQMSRRVLLATHVPPLRSACWHEGAISDDEWAPHFVCRAVGDALLQIMRLHLQNELLVLCGHTHSPGETHPLPGVTILTGGARYGAPTVQRVLTL